MTIAITFDQIRPLFGKPYTDPAVTAALATCGELEHYKPDKSTHYVSSAHLGLSLLFERPKRKKDAPCVLKTVFLYAEGEDDNRQFAHPPPEVVFADVAAIRSQLGAPTRSKDSAGRTDKDYWERDDGFTYAVSYGRNGNVRSWQIARTA